SNLFAVNAIQSNAGGGVDNQTGFAGNSGQVNGGTTTIIPNQAVNFSFNYWGNPNGPSVNGVVAGDSVTANNVDISPFLTTPHSDPSTPGYQSGSILGMRVTRRALSSASTTDYQQFAATGNFGYLNHA